MGQSLGFRVLTNDKFISKGAEGIPDRFTDRFAGRWGLMHEILESPHESVKDCGCGSVCSYGCPGDTLTRPTDFRALRSRLGASIDPPTEDNQIFREIVDWLESHPDVYVEYS